MFKFDVVTGHTTWIQWIKTTDTATFNQKPYGFVSTQYSKLAIGFHCKVYYLDWLAFNSVSEDKMTKWKSVSLSDVLNDCAVRQSEEAWVMQLNSISGIIIVSLIVNVFNCSIHPFHSKYRHLPPFSTYTQMNARHWCIQRLYSKQSRQLNRAKLFGLATINVDNRVENILLLLIQIFAMSAVGTKLFIKFCIFG